MVRAALLTAHELAGLRVQDAPSPRLAPDEVLIRVATVAVNQLDLNVISGRGPGAAARLPRILGLDPAGTILQCGAQVADRVGEVVVVKPNIPCGACRWCLAGDEADCPSQTVVGVHRDGGAAEFVAVPAASAFAIGTLAPERATSVVHSAPIVLNALEAVEVGPSDRVLVTGAGGTLGRAAVALARHRGARVTAASRRQLADEAALVEPDAAALAARLQRDGLRFDVVLDVSGHAATLAAAVSALDWKGRAVYCGASVDHTLTIDARDFYLQRKTLRGVASASYGHVREALALAEAGVLPDLIGARYELSDIAEAYANYPLPGGGKAVVHVR